MSMDFPYEYLQNKIVKCYENALVELEEAENYFKVAYALDMEAYRFDGTHLIGHINEYLRSGGLVKSMWEHNVLDQCKRIELKKALDDQVITREKYDFEIEDLNNAKNGEIEKQKQRIINLSTEGIIPDNIFDKCIKMLNKI